MAREIEAHGAELVLQALDRRPGFCRPEVQHHGRRGVLHTTEKAALPELFVVGATARLPQYLLDVRVHERPVAIEGVERAACGQRLQPALVERFGIESRCKIGKRCVGSFGLAALDDRLDGAAADVLEAGERVSDRAARTIRIRREFAARLLHGRRARLVELHRELDIRSIHARRQHGNAGLTRFADEHGELVGVRHVECHGRSEEFLAEVRLEIGRVIADECVGRRVALVEAVARELVDQLEDVARVLLLDALFLRALDEAGLLARHLRLVFLAHGAAQ